MKLVRPSPFRTRCGLAGTDWIHSSYELGLQTLFHLRDMWERSGISGSRAVSPRVYEAIPCLSVQTVAMETAVPIESTPHRAYTGAMLAI